VRHRRRGGLRPFSSITSSCVPDPTFFTRFLQTQENLIPSQQILFLDLAMKKAENRFHKRTNEELADFIKKQKTNYKNIKYLVCIHYL